MAKPFLVDGEQGEGTPRWRLPQNHEAALCLSPVPTARRCHPPGHAPAWQERHEEAATTRVSEAGEEVPEGWLPLPHSPGMPCEEENPRQLGMSPLWGQGDRRGPRCREVKGHTTRLSVKQGDGRSASCFSFCTVNGVLFGPSKATFFAFLCFLVVTLLFKITVLACGLQFPRARGRDVPRGETMC